ncbi:hypothetical protein PFDSM3638_07095 [Pyrococcus furiosus DSM 3638]|uniref:Uncharacterized protein n=3 Tax=Pyrococcus furiosus TaxID=2261 RepID=A0A5C0XQ90_PYRFU|nr:MULTISPECIES: hypothetical protein [Pyrococcus]AAL81540.1 hypothetical protein PF1416 [Pyrococcus furiosus DSM 3638]AFN04197.1 hypothetical protein PFC_06305 [Pyrococcus furiosus COM1]MDK2868860.1 hypothetical protein [Pyrococcus sp.]QEK79047.1 hypothetical protein PFDSM3638_07095 [Pyrococcus furiosus DSM 3638]
MKVVFKKSRFAKITIEISDFVINISNELDFSLEKVLREIFIKGNIEFEEHTEKEIKELEKKVEILEKRLYEVEGKWSSLKFKLFQISSDNRNLAIQVSGLMAENKRLREILNLPKRDFRKVEDIVKYYLNIKIEKERR